ncbi:MAG: family 10 glycosylhydrolase [Clostridia bacterium]|nr:family 10 glycosylhydrolase [Clostridia bacterium]
MLGVWMWPESIRRRGAEVVFEACLRAGVTDVFFLTKGLSGTTAFPSPFSDGQDRLRDALDAAHRRGMRLHAWFTSASDARYKGEHPESGLYHYRDGRNRDIVSLSCQPYVRFMQELIAGMLRRYEVDGVHLDYIRYNHLIYGWSEEDQRRYEADGVDLPHIRALMDKTFCGESPDGEAIFQAYRQGDQDALRLAATRRRDVTRFAAALCQAVRAERPEATLSAALMPEGAYDDLAFANLHYGQNYEDLAPLMDLFLPMAYSRAYGRDDAWVRQVTRGTVRWGVPTLTGVHAYDGATAQTLARDMAAVRSETDAAGACLFREGAAAWAFVDGKRLTLLNPLDKPVTACLIEGAEGRQAISTPVETDAQREFLLPFQPDAVQALAGQDEVCTLVVKESRCRPAMS